MENHHFYWENPLFLWPFSIAMLVHQRVGSFFFFFRIHLCKFLFLVLFEQKHVPMSKSAINIGQSSWKIRCGEEHLQQLT